MYPTSILSAALAGLALLGSATAYDTHTVAVGKDGLTFTPNSTVAAMGDIVEFIFYAKNHSVVQSTFNDPCESTSGFFSGFMPVASGQGNTTFSITVNSTKPIWFYCSQAGAGGHCAKGMVGCVNCPTTQNTLAAFAQKAAGTTAEDVTQPDVIGGGVLAANTGSSSSGGSGSGNTYPSGTSPSGSTSPSSPSSTPTGSASSIVASKWTTITLAGMTALAFFML